MSKDKINSRFWRLRKAYGTALLVMWSYARHWLLRKILGQHWHERRILALHLKNAERVKQAILELKGLFIKLGQLLSMLGNFLPEAFARPLEALQDQIPPRPYEEVQQRILLELGQPVETLFARFEPKALAAASIGQAHRAQLPDGTEVVVKVQHLHIETTAAVDLDIIRRLTAAMAWFYRIEGMDYLYTQIKKMIEEELDFRKEASSMQKIAQNLADEPRLHIPTILPAYSTERVMTSTWEDGVKINQIDQLDAWGLDRRDIATRVLQLYCRMVFQDGFYHADPHPGNILVKPNGDLILLDFGAVAEMNPALRTGIPLLIEAALKNDTPAMIQVCRSMGFIAEGRAADKMAAKMIGAFREFLQNEVQFEGLNLKEIKVNPLNNSLTKLLSDIGLSGLSGTVQVPKDYVLFNRTATLLLGLCSILDSTMNPLDVIRPYARSFAMGEKEGLFTFVRKMLQNSVTTVIGLPEEIGRVLQQVQKGELEFRSEDLRFSARLLYFAFHQILFLILAAAGVVLTYGLHGKGELTGAKLAGAATLICLWGFFRALRRGRKVLRNWGD